MMQGFGRPTRRRTKKNRRPIMAGNMNKIGMINVYKQLQ